MTTLQTLEMALKALEHASYCVQNDYLPNKMGHDWDEVIASLRQQIALEKMAENARELGLDYEPPHQDWCASLTQMLASMPPRPAPCNCKPEQKPADEPVAICEYCEKERPVIHAPQPAAQAEYERGFIDGMQKQMQSSVDKAVNAMSRQWVGLRWSDTPDEWVGNVAFMEGAKWAEKRLKGKNT